MRIWSLHPKYIDTKGLVALWRETLLAKNVLQGNTKGYKNHPQLIRFKKSENPIKSINYYLQIVWEEAKNRHYNFDINKFDIEKDIKKIPVTKGQIEYEKLHLMRKLLKREIERYEMFNKKVLDIHPLFILNDGDIENWEIV